MEVGQADNLLANGFIPEEPACLRGWWNQVHGERKRNLDAHSRVGWVMSLLEIEYVGLVFCDVEFACPSQR